MKYQIARAVKNTAYLTHYTAFEIYGLANQVYYEVYVASGPRFRDFEFQGITYRRVAPRINLRVVEPRNTHLDAYGVQALYQRVGYLLECFMKELQLSHEFIEYCRIQVG